MILPRFHCLDWEFLSYRNCPSVENVNRDETVVSISENAILRVKLVTGGAMIRGREPLGGAGFNYCIK